MSPVRLETPDFSQYRPNAGILLINQRGYIFMAERADVPGAWQLPQGGIDDGEDAAQAALRELYEETGIHTLEVLAPYPNWLVYDWPEGLGRKDGQGTWRGQAQRWFLCRFTGEDGQINVQAASHVEFSNWRWVTAAEVLAHAAPFRRPVYEHVLTHFAAHLQP